MEVRVEDLPWKGRWSSELKGACLPAQSTQDAALQARRGIKRSAEEAGLKSADEMTSFKRTKYESAYKKVTITWQHEVICEITALADEMAQQESADNRKQQSADNKQLQSARKRKAENSLDSSGATSEEADILDAVETMMSWKKVRTSRDGEEKSKTTEKTSSQSPSSTTAPSSAEKMRGFIQKGEEGGFRVTANPFLEERLPESRSTTVKELPDQAGFDSEEDDSEESGDDAYQIHSPCKNESAGIPWPEDEEELYNLLFGDDEEDDEDTALTTPKDLPPAPGAWRVDHGVQDWLEEGENKEQERLAAVKKIQPPSSEPVFFGFAGFPGFNLDQKYCPLSTTALKGFEAAWICSNTPASSTPEDKAMADDISLAGWT